MSIFTTVANADKSLFVGKGEPVEVTPEALLDEKPIEQKPVEPQPVKVVREYASNFGKYYVQVDIDGEVVEFAFDGEKPPAYEEVYKTADNYRTLMLAEKEAQPAAPELVPLNADNAIAYIQDVYASASVKLADAKAVLTEEEAKIAAFLGSKP